MIIIKNIFIFILCLLPWFVTSFVPVNNLFYKNLILPFFTPPNLFFIIGWTITYIGISLSITNLLNRYRFKEIPNSYKITLLINYLFNQSFQIVFFLFKNTFLGFISSLGTFISCLFLYQETTELNEKSTKFLNPYVLLSLFGSVLSLTIYVLNTR